MTAETRARLLVLSKVLTVAGACVAAIWGVSFIVAMRFVNRAPGQPMSGHPVEVWNNHGFLHYVPLSDDAFYEAVMSAVPFVIAVAGMGIALRWWLNGHHI
jgi:hypothetical protein